MIKQICVIAGGKATRLYPITHTIPKSLIDISGKPFIYRQFEIFKKNGINKVVLCLGVLGEKIEEYIKGENSFFRNFEIFYSYDFPVPLGTGGCILNALKYLDQNFFVIYGDSYLDINFKEISSFYEKQNKLGLMTIFKNDNLYDRSNVIYRNGKIIEYNKSVNKPEMNYIDYGLGILSKNAFNPFINQKNFDLEEVYKYLLKEDELLAYEVNSRFYEIGSKKGLEEMLNLFKNKIHT